jgi:O-antigen chain-terminating methyltransferase
VLDVGCGRGEFLELLRDRGVKAQGVDINPAMVEVCRGKGLQAETGDALGYLGRLPDRSLGGLFAAQVVEHLEPRYLMRLLDAAFDKLRPGAPIVLETINPACWFAFFESYIRDLTHVRPVHPDTLKYLLIATGFQRVEIRYRAPYPEADKLQVLTRASGAPTSLDDMIETLNANVEKINRLLFTYLDYAAIGVRG